MSDATSDIDLPLPKILMADAPGAGDRQFIVFTERALVLEFEGDADSFEILGAWSLLPNEPIPDDDTLIEEVREFIRLHDEDLDRFNAEHVL